MILPSIRVPESATQYGFSNDSIGAHSSRTIMLAEIQLLFAACPVSAAPDDYVLAIKEHNVLLKRTVSTRGESVRRLRELYGLDPDILLFRALRDLWDDDVQAQPLLALLCAVARDPVLRGTADMILSTPIGTPVTPHMISDAANKSFPDQFNPTTLANIGRHAASSWQQAGHLQGRLHKVRSQAASQPAAVAYALMLGYVCGERGDALFDTRWSRLLDAPAYTLHEQALAAAKRGWLEYRRAGGMTDVSFQHLLRGKGIRS